MGTSSQPAVVGGGESSSIPLKELPPARLVSSSATILSASLAPTTSDPFKLVNVGYCFVWQV